MKNLEEIERIIGKHKEELKRRYRINEIGISGSYVRGEQKRTSDIDILVKFDKRASIFDLAGAGEFLEEKLGIKVDIVSERGIRPELKSTISKEVIMV